MKKLSKLNEKQLIILSTTISVITALFITFLDFKFSKWRCPSCNHLFKSSFKDYTFAPHTPTKRRLNCPSCGETGWCKVSYKKEV